MYKMRENCCEAEDIFTSISGNYAGLVETFTLFVVVAGQLKLFAFLIQCITHFNGAA